MTWQKEMEFDWLEEAWKKFRPQKKEKSFCTFSKTQRNIFQSKNCENSKLGRVITKLMNAAKEAHKVTFSCQSWTTNFSTLFLSKLFVFHPPPLSPPFSFVHSTPATSVAILLSSVRGTGIARSMSDLCDDRIAQPNRTFFWNERKRNGDELKGEVSRFKLFRLNKYTIKNWLT